MIDSGLLAFNWAHTLLTELVKNGVQHAIISPGSRSTPLVLAASQIHSLEKRVSIDERSAAFQALGIAKATAKPVILICTSGTAAANYFPALIEAHISRIPLILITADRPPKLRNIGAQQTIDQVKLFGNHAVYFDLGEPNQADLPRVKVLAQQVIHEASKAFPVHINVALRKPLEPSEIPTDLEQVECGDFHFNLLKSDATDLLNELQVAQKPVFIFGPVSFPSQHHFQEMFTWAKKVGIPCITESLSQLPANMGLLEGFLRNEQSRTFLEPDLIVRFGRQPVSKSLELFLEHHKDVQHLHLDYLDVWHDSSFSTNQHIFGIIDWSLILDSGLDFDEDWTELWENITQENQVFQESVCDDSEQLTDGLVHKTVSEWNQFEAIHLSNSYPIRDFELFTSFQEKRIYCNRGANGIDGVISTALGNSVANSNMISLIGDIAFLHDSSSLVNHKNYPAKHTLIVINNSGGRIFEMLPISQQENELLTEYFLTPQSFSIQHIAQAFGINVAQVHTKTDLKSQLNQDFNGLRIIECVTDPVRSMNQRKLLWHVS